MKAYKVPLTDIVVVNTQERFMEERDGNPQGSYAVEQLDPEPPTPIGGDDADVNSFSTSLWDEE